MGSSGPLLKASQEANSNCFCGSRGPLPCYLKTLDSKQRPWSSSYEYPIHKGHSALIPNRSTQMQDFPRPCKRSRRGNQWDRITCNGTHIHVSRKSLAFDDWANLPLLSICFKTRDCNHPPPPPLETTTNLDLALSSQLRLNTLPSHGVSTSLQQKQYIPIDRYKA